MKNLQKLGTAAVIMSLLASAACTTNPETGNKRISKAGIGAIGGALGGYLLGDVVGGKHDRTEKIVGAGIGALAGAAIGNYMDQQEKKLREETAGTGVDVVREGDDIKLVMPSGITFDTNSYAINPAFNVTLDKVAQTLVQYEKTFVDVYGHTDSTGNDAINIPLSKNRAQSVSNYLTLRGVNSARIGVQGFGSSQPVASNDTEIGRQANRRVEIKLVPIREGN
ncbi:OmpA family protein [Aquisediminimonas sediminicola]|uniref:OmpA family protein n=1 Tax=Alteraquisediminimonas sediminicola TaxID=2676787 RepID=UPI001C8D5151|nr:OmpA family protein [Aquisediminimonas sediminicola]